MSVREEVYNYLLTVSSLTDIIGTRLYYVECHETPEYPMIVYKEFSRPTSYQTDDQWQRWRFYILAEDPHVCEDINSILKSNLNRAYGTFGIEEVDYIAHMNDLEIVFRDDEVYELISDYRVIFH